VVQFLQRGAAGEVPETPKELPPNIHNVILGNNALALRAAAARAEALGYRVLNLGSFVEGETRPVATAVAGVVRSIRADGLPVAPPACVLVGGETTVTLGPEAGKGGRNQEFVLAALHQLGDAGMRGVAVLSGGTDGEDGPTDAAGAVADESTWAAIRQRGSDVADYLARHDAYPLFDAVGGLIRTGLTQTNVMDVRVILVR
jgi:hydroxypyruvate reductase/glycerate 2-kinase